MIRIGPDIYPAKLVCPPHQSREILVFHALFWLERFVDENLNHFRWGGPDPPCIDFAEGPVNGEVIPLAQDMPTDLLRFFRIIDLHCRATTYTDFAHLPGNKSGM